MHKNEILSISLKSWILTIVTFVVLGGIYAYFLFVEDKLFEKYSPFDSVTNIIAISTSLVLLAVALRVNKKFSSGQMVIDKQTEATIQLIWTISSINFHYEYREGRNTKTNVHILKRSDQINIFNYEKLLQHDEVIPELINGQNLSQVSLYDMLQTLTEMSTNPYLPAELAEKVRKLQIKSCSFSSDVIDSVLPIVYVFGRFKETKQPPLFDIHSPSTYLESINGEDINVLAILRNLENTYLSSIRWLDKNNPEITKNLNIKQALY